MPGVGEDRVGPPSLAGDRLIYGVAALIGAAIVGLVVTMVAIDYAETRLAAEADLANLAAALEAEVSRTVVELDRSIAGAAAALELPGLDEAPPALRQAALFGPAAAGAPWSVTLLGPDGVPVAESTADPTPRPDADRSALRSWRDGTGTGLFIAPPSAPGPDGPSVIVFSRRLDGPGGSLRGVAAGRIPTAYFDELFSRLDIGRGGAVALFRLDGTVLARFPAEPGDLGRSLAGTEPFSTMRRAPAGIMAAASAIDGIDRIFAFRQVGSLPLLLTVGQDRRVVFAGWRHEATLVLACTTVLLAGTGALLVGLRQQLRRREAAERQALASAAAARRSERTLALSLAQLDTVFQHSADAHFAASRRTDGRFAFDLLNRRCQDVTGLRVERVLGRTPGECLPADLAASVQASWDRCLSGGEPVSYEQAFKPADKAMLWETFLVPVHDAAGEVCRLIGTARDVTDRRTAEAHLLDRNSTLERRAADAAAATDDALQRASAAERLQLLGQLASGIAHDVNNVLQSVAGGAALVERRADEPHAARRAARLIADAAARGASITNRLLTFSREDGASAQRVEVAPLLNDLADILRHTLRADGPIEVRLRCGDDGLTVFADRNGLETVLLNLATNARDAMPDGGTLLLAAAAAPPPSELAPGSWVRLSVEDDGSGMDAATLARATEPFFTTKPIGEGTGLGLSMADAFAREAGGHLDIDSRPGRGTVVALWLRR